MLVVRIWELPTYSFRQKAVSTKEDSKNQIMSQKEYTKDGKVKIIEIILKILLACSLNVVREADYNWVATHFHMHFPGTFPGIFKVKIKISQDSNLQEEMLP